MLDRLADRAMKECIPLSALFELTGRCNLDCCHCYLDIAHPPWEMTTEQAIGVVDQLVDAGTFFLTLTGGELFLRKDALVVAAHARRRGLALRLFTNATRITEELAQEIARIKPLAVEVSVYASSSAVHNAVTKRPKAFRRTLRGIVLLKRAGVNVGIKSPLLAQLSRPGGGHGGCAGAPASTGVGQAPGSSPSRRHSLRRGPPDGADLSDRRRLSLFNLSAVDRKRLEAAIQRNLGRRPGARPAQESSHQGPAR
jgi:hypothetical protein